MSAAPSPFINRSNTIAANDTGLPLFVCGAVCGGLLFRPFSGVELFAPWFVSDGADTSRCGRLRAGAGLGDVLTFSRHTGHVFAVLNHCCTQTLLDNTHDDSESRIIRTSKQFLCNQCGHSISFVRTSKGSYYSKSVIVSRCDLRERENTSTALTSSKQIGHLVSLSSLFHSLNVPVGSDAITSSGVALDRTSPNMVDNDNNASYESSNSSSGYENRP